MATRLSSNTPYTAAQLAAWFPVTTTAQVLSTIEFARRLVQEGQIDDGQYEQIQRSVGAYIDSKKETAYAAPTPTGGTGATATYRIVATYALPSIYGPGASMPPALGYPVAPSTPAGILPFRMWYTPAQGYQVVPGPTGNQALPGNQGNGRTRAYGSMQAATSTGARGGTMTMPAASANFPDVGFDILVSDGGTPPKWYYIGSALAAATFHDTGITGGLYSMYDPVNPSPGRSDRYYYSEVGIDTTTTPVTKLYALNTWVAPWIE